MKPFINVITLGVADLERSVAFYRDGLGPPTEGIIGTEFENGAVAFFPLQGGLLLALWPKQSFANEVQIPLSGPSPSELSLGHIVGSREEVAAIMDQAAAAGATIIDPARDRYFGGHSGYFQDPDGHVWEVLWNPELEISRED